MPSTLCLNELEIVEIEEREDENDLEIWATLPSVEIALPSVEIDSIDVPVLEIPSQSADIHAPSQEQQVSRSIFSNGGRKRTMNDKVNAQVSPCEQ